MTKKWLVLGSCRVVNTIAFEVSDNFILNNKDLWFTHYPHEHIQKINHLFGVKTIPNQHKELLIRFEQQSHYDPNTQLRVGDSIENGSVELQTNDCLGTLNVAVELPTTRYIKIPTDVGLLWGHIPNIELIRNSSFNQVGGFYTDADFLETLSDFEQTVIDLISSFGVAKAVNFIYIPHIPFIELNGGSWKISDERIHVFNLIRQHCSKKNQTTKLPTNRCSLDVKTMIEENGGIELVLEDQNHYSAQGRIVAFKHINKLATA